MSRYDQDSIAQFAGNSIRYFPALAHCLGSINAAVMLSQLIYWCGKGHRYDGYIFKTAKEMQYETGLTRHQQTSARKKLIELGLIHTKVAGIPAKVHYEIYLSEITSMLTSWHRTAPVDVKKALFKNAEKRKTITETTHYTTSKPP